MMVMRPLISFLIVELGCSNLQYLAAYKPNFLPNFDELLISPRFSEAV